MKRLLGLTVASFFAVAVARAEPIIVFDSAWNQDYAKNACMPFKEDLALKAAEPGWVDCQTAMFDARELVRRLQLQIESKFAVTTRCKGVTVLHPGFDGDFNLKAVNFYWKLVLYYSPGEKVQPWALLRSDDPFKGGPVAGEGTPAQIADEVCIVVTGQGANIP